MTAPDREQRQRLRHLAERGKKWSWPIVQELVDDEHLGWFTDEAHAEYVAAVYPNRILALLDTLEQAEQHSQRVIAERTYWHNQWQEAEARLAAVPALVEAAQAYLLHSVYQEKDRAHAKALKASLAAYQETTK